MTTVDKVEVFPDGNAIAYLPPFKGQSSVYFDTFWCVTHSHNKWCRTYLKARYWLNYDFADRDLVVLSGTKPNVGNSWNKVSETARSIWLVSPIFENWDMSSRDIKYTMERYYAYARTPHAELDAKEFNDNYEIYGEWVPRELWWEASKYWALQVYVNAWYKDHKEEYYNPTGKYNHAVLMANHATRQISDTYKPELKTLRSWNDAHYWALKITIIKKNMNKPSIKNNSLVILVEGSGSIGLYLDGKIIVDDVAKVLSVFMARNSKDWEFTWWPVRSLTQANWDMFEKRTL